MSPHPPTSRHTLRYVVAATALALVVAAVVAFAVPAGGEPLPEVDQGAWLSVGGFDHLVGAVTSADVIDFEVGRRRAEGEFAIVELTVVNQSDERRDLPADVFRLVDEGGRSYRSDAATNRYHNGAAWGVTLAPRERRELLLAFDVELDAVPFALEIASPDADPRRRDDDEPYAAEGRVRLD